MQFKVGDQVVHISQGSGQISSIEEKPASSGPSKLFYAVAINKSTVWVPVESGHASSLRPIISGTALAHCRTLLKSHPNALDPNRRQRTLDLNQRMQKGTFECFCEALRDLAAYGWLKPLNESDNSMFRKLQEAVSHEWALVTGTSQLEAMREITELLKEGQRLHFVKP